MTVRKAVLAGCAVLAVGAGGAASVSAQDGDNLGTPVVGESALVLPGDEPSVAYLEAEFGNDTASCTGTLVDPEWVLTAAHCVMLEDGTPADQVDVVIGSVDIEADIFVGPAPAGVEFWRSDGFVVHGDNAIGPANWFNDLAMIHLPGQSLITPMALATDTALTEPPSTNAELEASFYGFGLFQCDPSPGTCPDADLKLRRGDSTIYDDGRVDDLFVSVGLTSKELARNTFLVPNLDTMGGGCFGDSGGPMVVVQDGDFKLAGVSSFISTASADFCDGIGAGKGVILHATADMVGTDLGDWVRSITGAVETCNGVPVTITGSSQGDILVGTSGADVMHGRGGQDVILGRAGNDILCGGTSGDFISGGKGADHIRGNSGKDTIRGNSGKDNIRGGKGADNIRGGKGRDNIRGNSGKDDIQGNAGRDTIRGGSSGDDIDGGSGDDVIKGNSGRDDIFGGSGDDTITGGSGRDAIDGGSGDDSCSGGSGVDTVTSC